MKDKLLAETLRRLRQSVKSRELTPVTRLPWADIFLRLQRVCPTLPIAPVLAGQLDCEPSFRQDARPKGTEMHREENLASVADASSGQERFRVPPLTPLLAPMRSPSEKQFPIIIKKIMIVMAILSIAFPLQAGTKDSSKQSAISVASSISGEDGYRLWLRYEPVRDEALAKVYRARCGAIYLPGTDPTLAVARTELVAGLEGLLGATRLANDSSSSGTLIVGTPDSNPAVAALKLPLAGLGRDGYLIREVQCASGPTLVVAAEQPLGILYGSFALLRQLQTNRLIETIDQRSTPATQYRILNHWDNPDGTVVRGYSGQSLWKWQELPGTLDPRYTDYARACASIGINVVTLNNVNASPENLTAEYLVKTAALANVLRPYGIRVALVPLFDLPMLLGKLKTADPQDKQVIQWWKDKVEEIYRLIPDFAGFTIKADSEGRPGPHSYGLTHDFGANMMGELLAPHGGIVMWRAFSVRAPSNFVGKYYPEQPGKQDLVNGAYRAFSPLNGRFRKNVILQVKNGPRDFQPREVANPLFGALSKTPSFIELQIVQEYLGHNVHLCYLAPMWREALDFDTHAKGEGSTISKIVNGKVYDYQLTGAAGVANTGSDRNWTGHDFAQANWYAFGRLAWDLNLSSEAIAEEWARMTFTNNSQAVSTIVSMMMGSREAQVNYTGALGLIHLADKRKHYRPDPADREVFTGVNTTTIGIDRTSTGNNFVAQYPSPLRDLFENRATCPEKYLLFFHNVSWDEKVSSGRTVWEELVFRFRLGVQQVEQMQQQWKTLEGKIDAARFDGVTKKLEQQHASAVQWRDVCVKYFAEKSGRPIPAEATLVSCVNKENRKPNILIILADDLGWNDVGFHGSKIKTPNIDKISREGIQLNRFYVSAVCSPTRATLLTGRYPDRYGLPTNAFDTDYKLALPENEETIPEMLAKAGYERRGLVGKWHVGHSNEKFHPLNQGFTYFYGQYLGGVDYFTHKKLFAGRRVELDWHEGFESCYDKGYTTDLIGNKAIGFINETRKEEPFFLYVAFNAPHRPLQAKDEDLKEYGFNPEQDLMKPGAQGYGDQGRGNNIRQTYSAVVSCMDQAIGRILEALDRKGITQNTIVFFFSDNGAARDGDNSPLKGGKGNLWEGGIRVPCVVKWPENISPGTKSEAVTGCVDLMPTLREIVNAKTKPSNALDGISIFNLLKGGKDDPNRAIFIARYDHRVAVTREWKLFNNELYRIDNNPTEKENVASQFPEIVKDLTNRLNESGVKHIEVSEKEKGLKVLPEFKMPKE